MNKKIFLKIILPLIIFIVISSTQVSSLLSYDKKDEMQDISIDDILFRLKIRSYMRIINMPSVTVCVIKNSSIIYQDSYGFSNVFLRKKAKIDTIYVIGSISKTVTATAAMQLYEQGEFDLDDDISLYLPYNLKNPNFPDVNITFRMLMAHQSSLGDGFFDLLSYIPLSDDPGEWIKNRLVPGEEHYDEKFWKSYPPGYDVNYSNWGFILLSALVEQISGQHFEEYCQQNIFQPLNMNDTSFDIDKIDRRRIARPYYPVFAGLYFPMPKYDIRCASACGGLMSTVLDLSNFMMAHMNNGSWNGFPLLNNSTVELMHSIQYPNFTSPFYLGNLQHGLGWIHLNISGVLWEGYNGGAIGYSCNMMFRQHDHIGVVLFSNGHFKRTNSFLSDLKINLHYALADLFIQKATS